VLDGHEIIYVLRLQVQRILASGGSIGTRQPAHATSMGRVLLAWSDDKARDRALSPDLLQPRTKRTITDPDRLRDEIRVVREQGWSLVDGELEEGVAGISVPVINRAGRLVFALNVSASTARVPSAEMPTRFLPELRAVATELERTL
jgi:IclR family pca regulon transcriptional regulator